ncbi:MAG: type II secretion system F family protein [Planctomycetes bacterium]|nr:type II secretion system F family protein [Planctomycetota bacterium]
MIVAVQLALFLIIINALLSLAASIASNTARLLSGEQAALMPLGFMGNSKRIRRAIELQTVVSRLAVITRLNLPLCPALEAAAAGEIGRIRRTFEQMNLSIRSGVPVSTALTAGFRGCPTQLSEILRQAESCGQLTASLSEQEGILNRVIEFHVTSTPHSRHALGYAAFMILFIVTLTFWFMAMLMPKFRDIFLDFGVRLPDATMRLISISDWFMKYVWILPAILLATALILMLKLIYARRSIEPGIFSRFVATTRCAFPITRTMDYGLGMAQAIRSIALGIRSGASSAFSSSLPSVVSPTNHLRSRLAKFVEAISAGVSPHEAAGNANLGGMLVCALRMVERGEDAERSLGHAADYYEAIAYRWWHAMSALSGPLVTLCLGFLVGFIALALFMPLIALINAVSETI